MKRVMLYFGSFNPIHKGHIALADTEKKIFELVKNKGGKEIGRAHV